MDIMGFTWGLPLWFDMWLAGMGVGGFIVAFLINYFSGGAHKNLLRLSVYAGAPLAIIGVILVIIELGTSIWFWHLFTAFKVEAVMSMGIWALTAWITISFMLMAIWVLEGDGERNPSAYKYNIAGLMRKVSGPLGWINLVFAVLVISYPAVLIGATAQPIWASTMLFPAVVVASAICTGLALLVLLSMLINAINKGGSSMLHSVVKWLFGSADWEISTETIGKLAKTLVWALGIDIVIMAGYAIWLGIASGDALSILMTGTLALPFWLAVVLLGIVMPLVLLLLKRGEGMVTRASSGIIALASICVVLGGLALRIVTTISGQL